LPHVVLGTAYAQVMRMRSELYSSNNGLNVIFRLSHRLIVENESE